MQSLFSTTNKKLIYKNPWLRLIEYDILRRGKKDTYSVIDRKDCVLIIPITPSLKTLLLKQYRYPTNSVSWEFPMGAIEENETAEEAGKRELKEETNISANKIKKIGEFFPIPGLTPQKVFVYVVDINENQLTKAQLMEEDEILDLKLITIQGLSLMVKSKKITDGYTLSSITYLMPYLKK